MVRHAFERRSRHRCQRRNRADAFARCDDALSGTSKLLAPEPCSTPSILCPIPLTTRGSALKRWFCNQHASLRAEAFLVDTAALSAYWDKHRSATIGTPRLTTSAKRAFTAWARVATDHRALLAQFDHLDDDGRRSVAAAVARLRVKSKNAAMLLQMLPWVDDQRRGTLALSSPRSSSKKRMRKQRRRCSIGLTLRPTPADRLVRRVWRWRSTRRLHRFGVNVRLHGSRMWRNASSLHDAGGRDTKRHRGTSFCRCAGRLCSCRPIVGVTRRRSPRSPSGRTYGSCRLAF